MPVYFEYWKRIGNLSEHRKFLDNSDTPYSYVGKGHNAVRVNASETGLEFFTLNAAEKFTDLDDAPQGYVGNKGRVVCVNSNEDGLEFTELPPAGATTFLQLADVPTTYQGKAKILRTNDANNRLEFAEDVRKFIQLEDLYPRNYSGMAGRTIKVNPAENGLTFSYETEGVALLVVARKTDLPVIDVSDGRIAVTTLDYYNLYIFNSYLKKWKILTGINRYLNSAAFPINAGSFSIDQGTKCYDVTESLWKTYRNTSWTVDGDSIASIASPTELGVIKLGDRLTIDQTGKLSANLQSDYNFTGTYKAKLDGIEANANNYIHPEYHSAEIVVESVGKRFVSSDQIDRWENNSGFNVPIATDIQLGGIRVGDGLDIDTIGVLKVKKPLDIASETNLGGIKIGERVEINDAGVMSAAIQSDENFTTELKEKLVSISPQQIQVASTSRMGGVIIGQRISVNESGLISAVIQSDNNFDNFHLEKLNSVEYDANKYTHPDAHPAAMIVTDSNRRFVTDTEIAKWNAGGFIEWDNVIHRPETFTPTQHFHKLKDLTDAPPNYIPNMILKVNEEGTGYVFAEYHSGSSATTWKSGPGYPGMWELSFGTFSFDKVKDYGLSGSTIK